LDAWRTHTPLNWTAPSSSPTPWLPLVSLLLLQSTAHCPLPTATLSLLFPTRLTKSLPLFFRRVLTTMAPTPASTVPIVISGPSGAGKSTILKRLFAEHPGRFGFSVSHTTRQPRAGEQDGEHYHFVSRNEFERLIADNGFIEHAQFSGNLYGTSFAAVDERMRAGETCVLDIEMEGVKQFKRSGRQARYLFLAPPSMKVLEERLRSRATDKEEAILKRLEQAEREMEFSKTEGVHDLVVVNDDLDKAYQEVKDFCVVDSDGKQSSGGASA
jgi:guanylate kinase